MTENARNSDVERILQRITSAERLEEARKARSSRDKMVANLEAKYRSRGLKFTLPFAGAVPVQAYGRIDGLRFYFRFRGNVARLNCGPVDPVFEKRYADRSRESYMDNYRKDQKKPRDKDSFFPEDYWKKQADAVRPQTDADADFFPHKLTKASWCEGPIPGDKYNGSLSDGEAFTIFSKLVETLQDVPEQDQVDQWTRDWLAKKK